MFVLFTGKNKSQEMETHEINRFQLAHFYFIVIAFYKISLYKNNQKILLKKYLKFV